MTDTLPHLWLIGRETLGPLERVLIGMVGLAPLWGARDLVVRPWPVALTLAGLPFLTIGLVALAMTGVFFAAAVLGPEREVHVDPMARVIRDSGRADWIGPFSRAYAFDDIEGIDVRLDRQTDGPDRLQIVLYLRGARRPITLLTRPLADRPEVDALAEKLRAALQG
ncbi:MAG: hypothetical protein AVDCRST_MAG15-1822 [uncultured Rubellimicrobium sp.]|uniref:Uncharacterized protein n=1 Tax=uncultured Rubellimicrobium sp. TaxID=543078 RepID=A0A6J4PGC7_9RHOB|nr:MAG: hypothetical protein AVDCRST_MAG15-1822 [uncultured Rubellimicrobium sp.]